MTDTPHFFLPFQFENGSVPEVEEDSLQEVTQCVFAILSYHKGQLFWDPDFGIPEQAFRQGGISIDELREAVAVQEPRATVMIDSGEIDLFTMIDLANIRITSVDS